MKRRATNAFWKFFGTLPKEVRATARGNFRLLRDDPSHPSLRFKPAGRFWSARVGLRYRAIAVKAEEQYVWIWIGHHREYDRFIEK